MDSYFGHAGDNRGDPTPGPSREEDNNQVIPPKKSKTSVTASLSTVKKWEKELNITLVKTASQQDETVVQEIKCNVCILYSKDCSSSASFNL